MQRCKINIYYWSQHYEYSEILPSAGRPGLYSNYLRFWEISQTIIRTPNSSLIHLNLLLILLWIMLYEQCNQSCFLANKTSQYLPFRTIAVAGVGVVVLCVLGVVFKTYRRSKSAQLKISKDDWWNPLPQLQSTLSCNGVTFQQHYHRLRLRQVKWHTIQMKKRYCSSLTSF